MCEEGNSSTFFLLVIVLLLLLFRKRRQWRISSYLPSYECCAKALLLMRTMWLLAAHKTDDSIVMLCTVGSMCDSDGVVFYMPHACTHSLSAEKRVYLTMISHKLHVAELFIKTPKKTNNWNLCFYFTCLNFQYLFNIFFSIFSHCCSVWKVSFSSLGWNIINGITIFL